MNSSFKEILKKGELILNSINAEYSEIRISDSSATSIVLSGDHVESLSSGETAGGSIRILKNGGWGFISFNDFMTTV